MTCLTLIIAFTAIFFTAQTVVHLQVAEVLCGIVSSTPQPKVEISLTDSIIAMGCFSDS